jgi:hypothetical protein
VAWCDRKSALKSPRIPMRTGSLTGLIVLEQMQDDCRPKAHLGVSTVVQEKVTNIEVTLEKILEAKKGVETQKGKSGASPDHQRALPGQ